jgi:hypothetical protein
MTQLHRSWLTAALSVASLPALAHHSYIRIDRNSVVAFEGTVLDFQWRNPHVYLRVGTTDTNGNTIEWQVETGSTPILSHSGWSADALTVGDVISVRLHPERGTDRHYGVLQSLTAPDGTILRQGILPSKATERASSIAGIWKSRLEPGAPIEVFSALYRSFIEVPLTDAGHASIASYDHDNDNPTAVCGGYGLVAGLTSPHSRSSTIASSLKTSGSTRSAQSIWMAVATRLTASARGSVTRSVTGTATHSLSIRACSRPIGPRTALGLHPASENMSSNATDSATMAAI